MKVLFFLILISLLCGGSFILFYKYEQNITSILKDNQLLKNQISTLRNKYNALLDSQKNYSLEFLTIDEQYGLVPKNANVYLYPDEKSPILQKLSIGMQVGILEKVRTENSIWYYITLPIESNINSRGWIMESAFLNINSLPNKLYNN